MAGTRGVFHVLVKNTDEFRTVVSFYVYVCVCTKLLQSCPTLCNPMDDSPSGPSVHEILQQEYWSVLPCSPPGDLPDPEIKPLSITSPVLAGRFLTTNATREASFCFIKIVFIPIFLYIGIKTILIKLHRVS